MPCKTYGHFPDMSPIAFKMHCSNHNFMQRTVVQLVGLRAHPQRPPTMPIDINWLRPDRRGQVLCTTMSLWEMQRVMHRRNSGTLRLDPVILRRAGDPNLVRQAQRQRFKVDADARLGYRKPRLWTFLACCWPFQRAVDQQSFRRC